MPADRGKYEKLHPCGRGCGRSFTREHDAQRHVLTIHDKRESKCPYDGCDYAVSQESNLAAHVNKVHKNGLRPLECSVPGCTKSFGDPSIRSRHKKKCLAKYCEANGLDPQMFEKTRRKPTRRSKNRFPNVPVVVERVLEQDSVDPALAATQFGAFSLATVTLPRVPRIPAPPISSLADRETSPEYDEVDELFDTYEAPSRARSLALPLHSPSSSLVSSFSLLATPPAFAQQGVKQEIEAEQDLNWPWDLDRYFDFTAAGCSPTQMPMPLPIIPEMKPTTANVLPASNATGNLFGQTMPYLEPVLLNQQISPTAFVDPASAKIKLEETPTNLSMAMTTEPGVEVDFGDLSDFTSDGTLQQRFFGMQQVAQPSQVPAMLLPKFYMGLGFVNPAMVAGPNGFVPHYGLTNPVPQPQPLMANPYAQWLNFTPMVNQFNSFQGYF